MLIYASPVPIYVNPWYNPYFHHASGHGDFFDPGWVVYFHGSWGDNHFRGDGFADTMYGHGGEDRLEGKGGNDSLYGGADNDLLNGGPGADALFGGSGIDTATCEDASSGVNLNLQIGLGFGGEAAGDTFDSIENVTGSDWDDVIVGSDTLIGNVLDGGEGSDIIFGEAGNDTIIGGGGNDRMWGGTGADTFEWTQYTTNFLGADRIMDFDAETELLRFRFDDTGTASWSAEETDYEGTTGLMVTLTEDLPNGPFARYDVFLDGVSAVDFGEDNIEFY